MASFRKSGVNRPQKSSFINGSTTDTKFKSRPGVTVPNRVFVGGICPTATENDLLSLFGKYGTVKAVKIISDQNGSSKGYGFVTYEKSDDAARLQNEKNLMFNDRRLNIAPAVMKNPPFVGRFTDSYVVPITPSNIYFANNIPYQYQESTSVFPNSPYAPPLTVLPAVSDGAYYQNGYSSSPNFVPTTPYQGAALFYPVPHNTSPVMVGPQAYNSSYPSVSVSNSNYVYSSPATSSPPNTSAKTSTAVVASTVTNASEVHGVHGGGGSSQVVSTSVPPPLPYPLAHPPQYYNGSVAAPPYSGEVYYNMVQGACYPVMTVNGHDAYIPYYDVPDTCSNNVAPEENNYDAQNYHEITPNVQNYIAELNKKDTSPPTSSAVINSETKQMMSVVVSQTNSDHVQEQYIAAEANNVANAQVVTQVPVPVSATPQTPVVTGRTPHANTDYNNPSNYMQHRNAAAIIYQNTPVPPNNMYYNPIYLTEATTPALTQSPYPKNLSEHYVSDHLPKRDSKYSQKKFSTSPQSKDNAISIPNIPKFPFEYMNNNYPGFVNRNVKEKDYKNGNTKINDNKQLPRPPRSNSNGSTGPKPRVFHNQNQFTTSTAMPLPPRNTHRNGNAVPIHGNVPYPRSNSAGALRPMHDQIRHAYDYQNSYQGQINHQKINYEKKNPANGGGYYRKYEKANCGQLPVNHNNNNNNIPNNNNNSSVTNANETYSKNSISSVEDVTKKPIQTEVESGVKTNNNNNTTVNECPTPSEQNSVNTSSCGNTNVGLASNVPLPVPVSDNVQIQQQQQQQVCQEMQNLTL